MIKLLFDRLRSHFALSGQRKKTTSQTLKNWVLGAVFVLGCLPLLGTVYTYTRAGESARVYAATASTLNFQARLLNANGSLVSDGSYSVQFKLYDAVTGGTNEWTETQTVTVKNGHLSAYLGSVTPFSGTIDWSQEKWLTMNVNGDGEMTPRIKLTAVPYALRSGLADLLKITGGTISGDNLLQKAPGSVQSLSSANAGLRFNQTGAGGLLQLQGDGADVFTVDKAGNGSLAKGLTIGNSSSTTAGTLRWNGSDFQGYNGTSWVALTATGGTTPFVQGGNDFNADAVIGTTDNDALRFITNNTEKFTVLANGNIGVGDTTPIALFTVGTNDALQINASGNLSTTGTITSGLINGQDIDATANLSGMLSVTGLTTLNGGLTLEAGDTFTFNGDAFTDLTGNGLQNTGGLLSVVYGSSANTAIQGNTQITITAGTGLSGGGSFTLGAGGSQTLNLANTTVNANSYGSATDVATFTVDAQGRLTAAGTTKLSNSALTNSSIGLSYGTNLSGDASVALGGTLNINFSATPTFTSVTTGTVTNAGMLNLTATGAGNDINLTGADQIRLDANTTIELLDNTNITGNLDVSGSLNIGTNDALKIDSNGSLTATFRQLDGSTTATSGSGIGSSGTINVGNGNTANFDVGNYILVNGTYAKITAKTASALTITPNLTWSAGAAVTEYYIPEIGGTDTGSTLANRFGRGYFISGVATGNGTTYYNEDGISTSLTSFNLLNENVTTLNIGGAATSITLGATGTTVNVAGNLQTAANQTITAGGGLVVNTNGLNLNSTGITLAGAISGVTSLSASGSLTASTTNTINGLSINSGSLSGITGFSQTSGAFSVTGSGGITLGGGSNALTIDSTAFDVSSTGALSGITTLDASGLATITGGATISGGTINLNVGGVLRNTRINTGSSTGTVTIGGGSALLVIDSTAFDVSSTGDLSGIGTLSASGAITAATTTNTINGLIINAGSLSGITGFAQTVGSYSVTGTGAITLGGGSNSLTIDSTAFDITSTGAVSGVTTLSLSGAIAGATTSNTINGLVINSGSLSGITGFSQTSGAFSVTGSGGITLGGGSNALTIDSTNFDVSSAGALSGITTLSASGAITAATATNTINGLIINSGSLSGITGFSQASGAFSVTGTGNITLGAGSNALTINSTAFDVSSTGAISGVTTLALSGAITGATTSNTINGLIINSGALSGITTLATTSDVTVGGNLLVRQTGTGAALMLDRTDGVTASLKTGAAKSGFFFDSAGTFSISTDTRANILSGTGAGTDVLSILANGNATFSANLTVGTGLTLTSGNFAMSGTGTFGTGTGAISLNGATTVTGTNTFTVGTGLSSLGGGLTVTGLVTLNGNLTLQTGDTLTFNGDAFTDLTGNGLQITTGALNIDTSTTGTTAVTGSNSGLETTAAGVRLLGGCSNNQILKWSTTGPQWNCAADSTGISDARLKKNIESVNMDVLSRIREVNLYSFDYDCTNPAFQKMHCDTDHQQAGVIAQEIMQLFPELVIDVNGHYEVNYNALNLYNLKAVGELAHQVDELRINTGNSLSTGGVLRLDANGALQNITGLNMSSGGASIVGGLNNNGSGITSAGAITGVSSLSAHAIILNAAGDQNLLTLTKDGNGVFTVFNNGALELKLDSANAFAVKSANGDNALNIDTLTGKVKIGSGNNGKTVLFVLDSKSTDGDPAGVNGAQYYNSKMKKFRCYQNDRWQDCLQTAFSEYQIATGGAPWQQPSGDHELPGENRTWIDLSNANQARLLINISTSGADSANCRLQYSLTEDNPDWKDLTDTGSTTIGRTGAVKSDWLQIKDEAKKEVLVRVYCSGGNNQANFQYSSIRTQIR